MCIDASEGFIRQATLRKEEMMDGIISTRRLERFILKPQVAVKEGRNTREGRDGECRH